MNYCCANTASLSGKNNFSLKNIFVVFIIFHWVNWNMLKVPSAMYRILKKNKVEKHRKIEANVKLNVDV